MGGIFAGWNFRGWNFRGWNFRGWNFPGTSETVGTTKLFKTNKNIFHLQPLSSCELKIIFCLKFLKRESNKFHATLLLEKHF